MIDELLGKKCGSVLKTALRDQVDCRWLCLDRLKAFKERFLKAFFIADPGAAIPHILGTETLTICVRLTCPLAQPAVTDPRLAPLLRSQSGMDESVGQVGAVVEGLLQA